ncbi:dehyrdogenase reductase domain-containing [Fusarium albosuccineum]|uniref:Dehyrdogenase reductase domain-containing n=1 Tax=Fusarium albosuccineum TaxID=1237068 RepID=A0A8H4LA80_9HYPO|nr:dehyrdogenase reductase domain-containing [Fusarium albosuccineum]
MIRGGLRGVRGSPSWSQSSIATPNIQASIQAPAADFIGPRAGLLQQEKAHFFFYSPNFKRYPLLNNINMAHYINKLKDQRVLVVGGSTGIGFAVTEAALEHGADVIISSSNQTKIENAVRKLEKHIEAAQLPPRKVSGKACDLTNPDTLEQSVKSLLEFAAQDGKLDHVVFTAGDFLTLPSIDSVTLEDIAKVGMYIHQSSRSSLTFTTSTTHWRPRKGWSVLNGATGGIEAMARGLAIDLKPLRVNTVRSGFVRTELFDGFPEEALEAMWPAMERDCVVGKVGTAGELAEAYMYFMKNTFATGTTAEVDGGRMIGDSKED